MNEELHDTDIACPYCGETFSTLVDTSAGEQDYYEDCQVCCRPIRFVLSTDGSVQLFRDDD